MKTGTECVRERQCNKFTVVRPGLTLKYAVLQSAVLPTLQIAAYTALVQVVFLPREGAIQTEVFHL